MIGSGETVNEVERIRTPVRCLADENPGGKRTGSDGSSQAGGELDH